MTFADKVVGIFRRRNNKDEKHHTVRDCWREVIAWLCGQVRALVFVYPRAASRVQSSPSARLAVCNRCNT